jgi:hypothetical protein
MNRVAANIFSSIFFGVFTAPIFALIWFVVPSLRDFPVGDDSPHGVGLPTGFIFGAAIGVMLNSMFRWGHGGIIMGSVYLVAAVICCGVTIFMMSYVKGWNGFGWLLGFLACIHVIVSSLGLLLSGYFARRAKSPPSPSDIAET